jgi:steroid Delta-isomerase
MAATTGDGLQVLHRHVSLFNTAVRRGDFGKMLDGFTDDAELHFEGVPAGPFFGRDAIAAAYRDSPPDDEIEILEATELEDGTVIARYAWRADRGTPAGEMRLVRDGRRISGLVVTFDGPVETG